MSDRRVIGSKLSQRRTTPYDRPPATPANRVTADGSRVSTPLSIFARARSFLTPRLWRNSGGANGQNGANGGQLGPETPSSSGPSRLLASGLDGSSVTPFSHPAPAVPKPSGDKFDQIASTAPASATAFSSSSSSPNDRLSQFFKEKGDQQLSDVEMEGVLALIRQAKAEGDSLAVAPTAQAAHTPLAFKDNGPTFGSGAGAGAGAGTGTGAGATPSRQTLSPSPSSTPAYRPLYNSHHSTTKQSLPRQSTSRLHSPSRLYYTNVPTPYRPSPRASKLTSSRLKELVWSQSDSEGSETGSVTSVAASAPSTTVGSAIGSWRSSTASLGAPKSAESPESSAKKTISRTASTLLSLLGDEGQAAAHSQTPSTPAATTTASEDVKEFINPYVSAISSTSPTQAHASPNRVQRSAARPQATPKRSSAVDELQKTMPRQLKSAAQDGPASPSVFQFNGSASALAARDAKTLANLGKPAPEAAEPPKQAPKSLFSGSSSSNPPTNSLFSGPPTSDASPVRFTKSLAAEAPAKNPESQSKSNGSLFGFRPEQSSQSASGTSPSVLQPPQSKAPEAQSQPPVPAGATAATAATPAPTSLPSIGSNLVAVQFQFPDVPKVATRELSDQDRAKVEQYKRIYNF